METLGDLAPVQVNHPNFQSAVSIGFGSRSPALVIIYQFKAKMGIHISHFTAQVLGNIIIQSGENDVFIEKIPLKKLIKSM